MKSSKEELLAQAESLPLAEKKDFLDWSDHQGGERVIADSKLRAQLVNAGLALGVQSPKGKQQIASIIRLLPDGARLEPTPRRPKQQLPTIEDLKALITRIEAVEGHAAREMQIANEEDIKRLQAELAQAHIDHAETVHEELGKAFALRGSISEEARREALRRVGDDQEFPQRVFLSLIAC